MIRPSPLADQAHTDLEDQAYVARARTGDRGALEALVHRHQPWIYNIAVRMLYHPQDAEDAAQEILIKALTGLASFEGRSSFRTWLYRIVVNHVLNTKRGRLEPEAMTFGCYGHGLDSTPDLDLPDQSSVGADVNVLVEEARITCTSGMLLCLDREQRLIYIFNAQPFFTLLLLPWFVPSERLTARRGAGTALAFVGVVLVLLERGTAGGSLWGDLLVLLGALGWTGNTILNKLMPRELPTVSAILWSVAGAIPAMAVLTLLLEPRGRWHMTAAAVGSVLYLGAVVAGLGFVVFVWLTRTYSPSRVNVFVFLSPVFGVLIGWAVLDEPISALQALGGLAVAAGILVVNTRG